MAAIVLIYLCHGYCVHRLSRNNISVLIYCTCKIMLSGLYEEAVQVGALQWRDSMLLCQHFKIQHSSGNNQEVVLEMRFAIYILSCCQVSLVGLLHLCFCK